MPDGDPVASAVSADQIAAHAATPRGHHGPIHTHCENCGTALQGPFCHACGQHDFEFHRSFGHVCLEALENFLHFDAKFFRNIVTLLFRPGALTAEFNAGRRASQMPPFRLYLFVSVLFFLIGFVGREAGFLEEERAKVTHAPGSAAPAHAPESAAPAAAPQPQTQLPGGVKVSLSEKNDTEFERYLTARGRYAFDHPHELKEAFVHAVPRMLLVCLPLFAVFTRVLFRRSGQVYLQHLVLALHFHTFIYLFLMVRDGWVGLGGFAHVGGLVSFAAGLWLALYPFLMFRRLFGTTWWGTIWRTAALAVAYGMLLSLAFVSMLMLIFVTL